MTVVAYCENSVQYDGFFGIQIVQNSISASLVLIYRVGQKVSYNCIVSCNFVNYGPIYRNSTDRTLTKFPERCMLFVNC